MKITLSEYEIKKIVIDALEERFPEHAVSAIETETVLLGALTGKFKGFEVTLAGPNGRDPEDDA